MGQLGRKNRSCGDLHAWAHQATRGPANGKSMNTLMNSNQAGADKRTPQMLSRYSDAQIEDILLMARFLAPDDLDKGNDAHREVWYGPGRPDWFNSDTDFVATLRRSMPPEELDRHLDEMKAAISGEIAAMWEREEKRQLAKKPRHERNQRDKRERQNGR